jgi:hypothetical protein
MSCNAFSTELFERLYLLRRTPQQVFTIEIGFLLWKLVTEILELKLSSFILPPTNSRRQSCSTSVGKEAFFHVSGGPKRRGKREKEGNKNARTEENKEEKKKGKGRSKDNGRSVLDVEVLSVTFFANTV